MQLRQLEYFVQVVELGSVSKASSTLSIAQPAISRQIRKLEDELGARLLVRDGRGVKTTPLGELFVSRARDILRDLKQMKAEISDSVGEPMDELNIGIPPVVGSEFIAELVRRFRVNYPLANLRVIEGFSYQIVDWIQLGRLDLGLIYAPGYYNKIDVRTIANQGLHLIGPPDQKDFVEANHNFEDCVKLPLILPVRPNSFWEMLQHGAKLKQVEINLLLEVDSIFAIRKLVKQGEGFSVMPYSAVHEDVSRGELIATRITNPDLVQPIAIAFPKRGINTLTGNKLVELIDEIVREFVEQGKWSVA